MLQVRPAKEVEMITGYMHHGYAESLVEFGTPRHLPLSGGWILERQIPGSQYKDAMGCYPLFACRDWSQLYLDLKEIADELLSLAVVTDPFGNYDVNCLQQCFVDVAIPFKEHYIIDLSRPMSTFVSKHHCRYAQKAFGDISVERCDDPQRFLSEWVDLYASLVTKHNITGIPAFSKTAFAQQLSVPGIVIFRAICDERTVGMLLWYVQGKLGYYHLGAYSSLGYDLHASFALFWFVIEYFAANGLRWLNLGAGAGVEGNGTDGLSRFKRGWSTGTRTAYFCGHIFNRTKYLETVQAKEISITDYFPAYRAGEFG